MKKQICYLLVQLMMFIDLDTDKLVVDYKQLVKMNELDKDWQISYKRQMEFTRATEAEWI